MRNRVSSWIAASAVGASLLAGGCTPGRSAQSVGAAPQPNPLPSVAVDVKERLKAARTLVDEVQKLADRLPTDNDDEQRRVMQDVFDHLARLLPMLMGPQADGQFRLQQRIVADARDQMGRSENRLALAPMIDSGLRASYNALVRVGQESFYTNSGVIEAVSELRARTDALDRVRGPGHRQAVADAVRQIAAVMDRMVRIYDARLDRREPEKAVPNPSALPPSAVEAGKR